MKFINTTQLKNKLLKISLLVRNHKLKTIIGLIILVIISGIVIYIQKKINIRTYYVAYVGRYSNPSFDRLHELAINKYLEELNSELVGAKVELKKYNLLDYREDSALLYQDIVGNDRTIIVIDNSWGKDFQKVVTPIQNGQIPVININSDKSVADYGKNVVFLGHDDGVPNKVSNFCKKVLERKKLVFITELDYPLTIKFREEFAKNNIEIIEIPVSSNVPNDNDRVNLFSNLKTSLTQLQSESSAKTATVVLNIHQNWGNEVISHLEKEFSNIEIVGGSYIINGAKYEDSFGRFDQKKKGNKLIMLNAPGDSVSQKIYGDFNALKMTKGEDPAVFKDIKARLYVKRCLDAVSLIRGALKEKGNLIDGISRNDFFHFFHNYLIGRQYISSLDELYIFDENLMLFDERPFELRTEGEIISNNKQLDNSLNSVSNVYFGIELINVSNINIEEKSFHADFFYWVKGTNDNSNIDQYIQFRNERKQNVEKDIPLINRNEAGMYKLFKKSAVFNMDVDFRKYPFDSQELRIEVEIIDPKNNVTISFDSSNLETSKKKAEKLNLEEWKIMDFYVTVDNFIATSFRGGFIPENRSPQKFKTLNVRMPISRGSTVPFVTIILPLMMIGIASIALLFIKDNSFAHIGEVCVGIFLSIVTYSISFAQLTPRSDTLTIADLLFYGTFFLVLLIFLKVILFNSNLISDNTKDFFAKRTNKLGYATFGIYFFLLIIIVIYAQG